MVGVLRNVKALLDAQPVGTYCLTDGYVWIRIDSPESRSWFREDVWALIGWGYGHSNEEMARIVIENEDKNIPWGLY